MPWYSQQEDFCIHPKEVTLPWRSGESYQHWSPQGSVQSKSSQKIWLSCWSQYSVWLWLGPCRWTADISSCNSKQHMGANDVWLSHLWLSACSLELQSKPWACLNRTTISHYEESWYLCREVEREKLEFPFSMLTMWGHHKAEGNSDSINTDKEWSFSLISCGPGSDLKHCVCTQNKTNPTSLRTWFSQTREFWLCPLRPTLEEGVLNVAWGNSAYLHSNSNYPYRGMNLHETLIFLKAVINFFF